MADPILHIKDAYFFEVPRALWRSNYQSLEQVPEFLREYHPDIKDPGVFNEGLHGKILIPQPFGELTNLYEKKSGFAISKFMIVEVVVALLLIATFVWLASRMREGTVPRGKVWNLFESFLVYLRDNVARPAIGHHDADRFLPLLWTIFFFILGCNLMGLIPWVGAPTGAFGATLGLAAVTFATVLVSGMIKFGPIGFWKNQVPHMDLPLLLSPLKLVIFVIEVVGLLIRHAILAVRLLANMAAGHLVLLGIMSLITAAAAGSTGNWTLVTVIAVLGSTLFTCLELFVAFLQAYIFTFLSALFIGAAVHHH